MAMPRHLKNAQEIQRQKFFSTIFVASIEKGRNFVGGPLSPWSFLPLTNSMNENSVIILVVDMSQQSFLMLPLTLSDTLSFQGYSH